MNPIVPQQRGIDVTRGGKPPGRFRRFSTMTARALGSSTAFVVAVAAIVVWLITGPIFHYSDTWQLVINTATNLITFLMVFIIQNTQNRDATALHLKLDELIRSAHGARNHMINLEDLDDEELEKLREQFRSYGERGGHGAPPAGARPAERMTNGREERHEGT